MREIAIWDKMSGTELDVVGQDGTEQDWKGTVLSLKIPLIIAHEWNMRFINTIPNKLEQYLLFKNIHKCSSF